MDLGIKIASKIIRKIKPTFSKIKTSFLKNPRLARSSENRSESDYSSYPEFALKAALDPKTFSIFRRHHEYIDVVETVNKEIGEMYLEIIRYKYQLSIKEILEIIDPLQITGQPKLITIRGLPERISSLGLRYLKTALDIKELIGKDTIDNIVEIGCGFGGQAIILDKVCKIKSYTFLDLWQVNLLIKRFIENTSFSPKYTISTIREYHKKIDCFDLVISNYAFSELPIQLQEQYFDEIISNSKNGYLTMNSKVEGGTFNVKSSMSKAEIKERIPKCIFSEEKPKTYINNYLVHWCDK